VWSKSPASQGLAISQISATHPLQVLSPPTWTKAMASWLVPHPRTEGFS
jgi:hypothetical protein